MAAANSRSTFHPLHRRLKGPDPIALPLLLAIGAEGGDRRSDRRKRVGGRKQRRHKES